MVIISDSGGGLPNRGNGSLVKPKNSADLSSQTLVMGGGNLEANQIRDWTRMQIVYPNFAGNDEIASRALDWVTSYKLYYDRATFELQRKWQILWALYQGRSLLGYGDGDIAATHVPEFWKMVETIAPRLEEPFVQHDPFFEVVGREKLDKEPAKKIRALLQWELSENRIDQLLADMDRIALIYGFAVVKSWWAVDILSVVQRNIKRESVKGGVQFTSRPEIVDKVKYEGPRLRLVDPPCFFTDLTVGNMEDAAISGDSKLMTFEEIASEGERLGWKNIEQLEGAAPQHEQTYGNYSRQLRSLSWPYNIEENRRKSDGAPEKYWVTEAWGLFRMRHGERARECRVTIANNGVVLCVQENPHDDKHRPYSLWKTCPHPFEFHSMGVLDHLIPLSIEYDRQRRIMSKSVELAGCPVLMADPDMDLPSSLWNVRPGEILNAKPGSIVPLEVRADISGMRFYSEILRRDHEEAAGAPRIWEGSASNGATTATEVERKIQEGNRRLVQLIRGKARMLSSVLGNMHALNQQFMRQSTSFRVIGRAAATLGQIQEIGPDEVATSIDFDFIGLRTSKSVGLEAASISSFFQVASGILQTNPELAKDIKALPLLRYLLDATVGVAPNDEIITLPDEPEASIPQFLENQMLIEGRDVPVNDNDDHEQHMDDMAEIMVEIERYDENVKIKILEHFLTHEMRAEKEKQQPPPQQGQMGMATPGQGTAPQQQQQQQQQMVMPGIPSQSPQGQVPGPPNAARQRKPGRVMTPFQSEGMGMQ